MRFYRLLHAKRPRYAIEENPGYRLLNGNPWEGWQPAKKAVKPNHAVLMAPADPSKVVAVGLNYRSHAEELHMRLPAEPLIFLKPPTSVAASKDAIPRPEGVEHIDYEGELALVVGKMARHIPEEQALEYLLGATLANDVTARDLQERDGQWTRAKSFDGFCPLGPAIATEVNWEALEFKTLVNDQVRQVGRVSDFIFPIPRLLSFISGIMTLLPGDVILTGTPPGVGSLSPGDRVRVECDAIGVLENQLIA